MSKNYYRSQRPTPSERQFANQGNYQSFSGRYHPRRPTKSPKETPRLTLNKKSILLIIIYSVIIVCAWFVFPFRQVNHIQVDGNQLIDASAIQYVSGIQRFEQAQKVLKNSDQIEAQLQYTYPIIESVAITRPNWYSLQLTVTESPAVAQVNFDQERATLTANGSLLLSPIDDTPLPEIVNYDQKGRLANLASMLGEIKAPVRQQIKAVYLSPSDQSSDRIELEMHDGNLVVGIQATLADKMNYYDQIITELDGKVGLINFEVGAYYTPDISGAYLVKQNED